MLGTLFCGLVYCRMYVYNRDSTHIACNTISSKGKRRRKELFEWWVDIHRKILHSHQCHCRQSETLLFVIIQKWKAMLMGDLGANFKVIETQ